MDALTNSVESLWNFVISMIWRLWICFAVIVFVHVKCGVSPLSYTASKMSKTSGVSKGSPSSAIRKTIKLAKTLIRRNKLGDADAVLKEGILLSEEVLQCNGSDLCKCRSLIGCLHEIRALCLYRKGDVVGSIVEMDRGLAVVKNPGSHLLTSANHCFQLFHKWCCENVDHFQQDIVMYFQDKKRRLEMAALEKIANTSLLVESIHCLILSEVLVKREILELTESTDLKMLCQSFYCLLKSEEGDEQLENSLGSITKPLDLQTPANEIKCNDSVEKTEEVSVLTCGQTVCGSEIPTLRGKCEEFEEEGPCELETLTNESSYFETMHEARARSLVE